MTTPRSDELHLIPLTTDAEIQERAGQLIGRANSRRVWFLFLDERQLQLPLLIPIDGLPGGPVHDQTAQVLERVREVMGEVGATSVVTVLERYGSAILTPGDVEWARSLRGGCDERGIHLRAQLLSHRNGVSWIAEDEIS